MLIEKSKLSFIILVGLVVLGVIGASFYFFYLEKLGRFPLVSLKITIPEGYNTRDIAGKFKVFANFDKENFLKLTPQNEGYLFPDTYFFTGRENEAEIIRIMRNNFQNKAGSVKTEILIMASMLEREARTIKDKKIIAGILWKRLNNDMLLQVDATLNYLNNKTSLEMTKDDLKFDSPYNTYLYKGLPPTPICNPGLESIEAASQPTETEYWYYLSDKKGNIHYAKTFEEHKANKMRYLR